MSATWSWEEQMMFEHAPDLFTRLRQGWRRALSNRRAINEMAACPPGELRRIGSDVGLSVNDLRRLCCSHNGPSELLPQRLQLMGIDPEFLRHAAPASARHRARGWA